MNDDPLDPRLASRLREELDRVQPPHSAPRYLSAHTRPIALRLAPAVLVASVISMLALSAYVATGSPNPADWGHDVVTIIQSSSTTPTPSVRPTPTHAPEQESTEKPGEQESPEPSGHQSPEPSDDHSGEGTSGHDGGGSSDGGSTDGGSTDGGSNDEHEGSSSDSGQSRRS